MDAADEQLKKLMGIGTAPSMQAVNGLGLVLWGAGLVGAGLDANGYPLYGDVTRSATDSLAVIQNRFAGDMATAEANVTAGIAGQEAKAVADIGSGLAARGITDPAQAATSQSRYKQSLSGAYAAAHSALAKAKFEAQGTSDKAVASYYTELSKRQFESQLAAYAAKRGIWKTLGGLGGSLLAMKGNTGAAESNIPTESPVMPGFPGEETFGVDEIKRTVV